MLKEMFMLEIKVNPFLLTIICLTTFLSIEIFKSRETPEHKYLRTTHVYAKQIESLNKQLLNPGWKTQCFTNSVGSK